MNLNAKTRLLTLLLLASFVATNVQAQISVRSTLSDDHEAAPGTTYEGTIMVRNDSDEPQQAKIYQTDYVFYADGTNLYGEAGHEARSNASWITYTPALLTLPPQQTLPIHYTVTVPEARDGQPLEGTYWSMLMVEGIPPESPESTLPGAEDEIQYGLRQVMRYGVQIATHVQSTGDHAVAFAAADLLQDEEGGRWLHLDVENEGSLLIRPDVWIELYDDSGEQAARLEGAKQRIYPGTSVRQRINLNSLAPGPYMALVVVDAGGENIFAAQYTLEL